MNLFLKSSLFLASFCSLGCITRHGDTPLSLNADLKLSCAFDHNFDSGTYRVIKFVLENTGMDPINVATESFSMPGDGASIAGTKEILELQNNLVEYKQGHAGARTLGTLLTIATAVKLNDAPAAALGTAVAAAAIGSMAASAASPPDEMRPTEKLSSNHLLGSPLRLLAGEVAEKRVVIKSADWNATKHFTLCLLDRQSTCLGGQLKTQYQGRPKICELQAPNSAD